MTSTTIDIMDAFKSILDEVKQSWPETDRQLAIDAAQDYATLRARKALGDDGVDEELAAATATLLNLSVAGSLTAANLMDAAVQKAVVWAGKFLVNAVLT